MVDMDVCVSSHLKEELAWTADKQLRVISIIMLFYSTKELKNEAVLNLKQYRLCCYVALSNIFRDSFYHSSLASQTHLTHVCVYHYVALHYK